MGDYPDAENFLQLFRGPNASPGPNNANYRSPAYDELFTKMAPMPPGPERDAVIRKMLRIVHRDSPWIYTDYRVRHVVVQPWLRGHEWSALQRLVPNEYDIDLEERSRRTKR